MSYLNECIFDRYEEDLKNPFAYSWEGGNYSRGHSPHLIDCSGETGECVRSLSKASSEVTTGNRRRVSCGVQSSGVNKDVYELPAIESLGVPTACI